MRSWKRQAGLKGDGQVGRYCGCPGRGDRQWPKNVGWGGDFAIKVLTTQVGLGIPETHIILGEYGCLLVTLISEDRDKESPEFQLRN